jgi:hypothetical protein
MYRSVVTTDAWPNRNWIFVIGTPRSARRQVYSWRRGSLYRSFDLLGHASVKTTERYDNQTMEALQAAAAKLETSSSAEAVTLFQESFKNDLQQDRPVQSDDAYESELRSLQDEGLGDWLGGRDLNPDNVVQRRKGRMRR